VGLVVGESHSPPTNHGTSFESMPQVNLAAAEPDLAEGMQPRRARSACRPSAGRRCSARAVLHNAANKQE
jgi:hypothetical protein